MPRSRDVRPGSLHPDMPKKAARTGGRYNIREITLRVERLRVALHLSAKETAAAIGIEPSLYSHKVALRRTSFSLEELGAIADFFSAKAGRPLLGWPVLADELVSFLDGKFGGHH